MSEGGVEQMLRVGMEHHRAGRLREAEGIYRAVLAREPGNAEGLHLLGMVAGQVGQFKVAIDLIRRAIGIRPGDPVYASNLGKFLIDDGQLDAAIETCRRALALRPDLGGALFNLGWALQKKKAFDQAVDAYRRALAINPTMAEAHNNLGNVLQAQGKHEESVASSREALRLRPGHAPYLHNMGITLSMMGRTDEAIDVFRRTLALQADFAEAHNSLGRSLWEKGRLEEAMASYRQALALKPGLAEAHASLGLAQHNKGEVDEAIASFRQAIFWRPEMALVYNNLGQALKDQELLEEAMAGYRRAMELEPENAGFHSNLLIALNYVDSSTQESLLEAARAWGRRHAEPLARFITAHGNDRDPDRRLRVGYVSPDFRIHAVAQFMLPLLAAHDREKVEVFCYSDVAVPDAVTERLRGRADHWRGIVGMKDERVCEMIRGDRIDVLIDLAMHAAGNRLLVFARKAAPVQAAYLAYAGTTGVAAMDYRITDPYLDPPDSNAYSEQSIHLPETFWCYEPAAEAPEVGELPSTRAGYVTFGCYNNFCKVSAAAVEAWGAILRAVPGSRLRLHAMAGSHRERVCAALERAGISGERCEFIPQVPRREYLAQYQLVDIALDPFPYAGGTTTCDALWMGVPVVTLAGRTAVGRGGVSILSNVGLRELIAKDVEEYVRIAVGLARDVARMGELRAGLRERMRGSPLMDGARFAGHFEAALRRMWHAWCSRRDRA